MTEVTLYKNDETWTLHKNCKGELFLFDSDPRYGGYWKMFTSIEDAKKDGWHLEPSLKWRTIWKLQFIWWHIIGRHNQRFQTWLKNRRETHIENTRVRHLPVVELNGQRWYIDERLEQIRKVTNPSNYYDFQELDEVDWSKVERIITA